MTEKDTDLILDNKSQVISLESGEHIKVKMPVITLDPSRTWEENFAILRLMKNNDHVAIKFKTFTDGRGYSLASRIKERSIIKFIHALGNISEELSYFLRRSGFDFAHFPLRKNSISTPNKVLETKKLLTPFSTHYQLGNE